MAPHMKMFARLTGQTFGDWAVNDRQTQVRTQKQMSREGHDGSNQGVLDWLTLVSENARHGSPLFSKKLWSIIYYFCGERWGA